jgi:glutathione peroxidase
MNHLLLSGLVVVLLSTLPASAHAASSCSAPFNHQLTSLQGQPADLCEYQGKVVMVVNTASYCGYTPQYKALEAIYEKYKAQGFVVLGFPANDFGGQEPGSNAEVADFCERTYKVKFPMFSKSSVVKGGDNPVIAELAAKTGQWPEWNFHKYLIDRSGKNVISYASRENPAMPDITSQIEKLLKADR